MILLQRTKCIRYEITCCYKGIGFAVGLFLCMLVRSFPSGGGNESSVTSLGMLWKGKSAYFMSVNKS
ncbi:hypothetical protein APHWI1_1104 [Anaplasma phagocytophilum str. ApWI1]|uniref:Uncharacterized protein n=2 Tax=Anaplasma phagocytophilum TaxID=948 RepID=A0A0F3NNA6_ANAPH|nr:hypothetical protein YYU_00515 [Anaplasma phagocytophilum str. HZ2]AGR80440.1 hypothetical protein WSQ_00515 [Anaplasma phagocytophilum str. JM]KJV68384.1 hypothetical protein EPHNCH_0316 [Anaplasma phagocytophilum str. NCH-1]KJV82710.1 hypothetical protein APHHGE2_0330 [Anaplasma phagocytophilum str. HGE2]KJV85472.1 hypothetical protein APHWI1_1104 [Anaplasma phagocytophilum str. ApWI1]KJV88464.1 hypothetical protein APHNYW_0055 [Anaplasma phagocytophilum str. ApNYW]KJZ98430.1 hypothetica